MIFFAYAYANPNAASHTRASSGEGARVAVRRDVGERVIDAFIYGASVETRLYANE